MVRVILVSSVLVCGVLADPPIDGAPDAAAEATQKSPRTFAELSASVTDLLSRASQIAEAAEEQPDGGQAHDYRAMRLRTAEAVSRMCLRFGAESSAPERERRAANVLAGMVALNGDATPRAAALTRLQERAAARQAAAATRPGLERSGPAPLDDLDVLECFVESSLLCGLGDAEKNPQRFIDALAPLQRLLDAPVTQPDVQGELIKPLLAVLRIDLDAPIEFCVKLRQADINYMTAVRLAESDPVAAKTRAQTAMATYRDIVARCPNQRGRVFARADGGVYTVEQNSTLKPVLAESR